MEGEMSSVGLIYDEYDWYSMGASSRQSIKGKMVAGAVDGRKPTDNDDEQHGNVVKNQQLK